MVWWRNRETVGEAHGILSIIKFRTADGFAFIRRVRALPEYWVINKASRPGAALPAPPLHSLPGDVQYSVFWPIQASYIFKVLPTHRRLDTFMHAVQPNTWRNMAILLHITKSYWIKSHLFVLRAVKTATYDQGYCKMCVTVQIFARTRKRAIRGKLPVTVTAIVRPISL